MKIVFKPKQSNDQAPVEASPEQERDLEDDDGFGVLADHVIAQISHEKEAAPDKFQVSKLSRLNAEPGADATFKKRKLNKTQGRRAVTTKDDM
jgi:hypothetical protein